jgi:hypothetical protein
MSGSNQQQSTQTTGIPDEFKPYLSGIMNAGVNAAQQPYQPYTGMRVAPFTGMQDQAFQGMQGNMNGSPLTASSNQYLFGQLNGQGYDNPYLQGAIDQGSRSLTDRFRQETNGLASRFSGAGAFGGSAHQQAQEAANRGLSTGLSDLESSMRFNNYNAAANRQMQAAPMAWNAMQGQQSLYNDALRAGTLQQQYGQSLLDSLYGDFTQQRDYNRGNIDWLANLLRGAGSQTTLTQPGADRVSQGLGSAALLASIFR